MKTKRVLLYYSYWKTTTKEGINAKVEDRLDLLELDVNSGVVSETYSYGYSWIAKLKKEYRINKYIQAAKAVLYKGKKRHLLSTVYKYI